MSGLGCCGMSTLSLFPIFLICSVVGFPEGLWMGFEFCCQKMLPACVHACQNIRCDGR